MTMCEIGWLDGLRYNLAEQWILSNTFLDGTGFLQMVNFSERGLTWPFKTSKPVPCLLMWPS